LRKIYSRGHDLGHETDIQVGQKSSIWHRSIYNNNRNNNVYFSLHYKENKNNYSECLWPLVPLSSVGCSWWVWQTSDVLCRLPSPVWTTNAKDRSQASVDRLAKWIPDNQAYTQMCSHACIFCYICLGHLKLQAQNTESSA